jgi:hypothetical protein
MGPSQSVRHLKSISAGHPLVEESDVEAARSRRLKSRRTILNGRDAESLRGENVRECLASARVVVGDQYPEVSVADHFALVCTYSTAILSPELGCASESQASKIVVAYSCRFGRTWE